MKNEIIEPVQVSCTLALKRIEIIEPVQVSCISVQNAIWDTQVHFCSVYYTQL